MSLILHIDTATQQASVSLTGNGVVINSIRCTEQKQHASFVQPAIKKILADSNKKLTDINAVAVTIGPGSYTGLRVGLASAKGICFACNIPLIAVSTLKLMAHSLKKIKANYYCPMIDARRMEVFTAVYNDTLENVMKEQALILQEDSFDEFLSKGTIVFGGDGSIKCKTLLGKNKNASFKEAVETADSFAQLSYDLFRQSAFSDLAYTEPVYLKEFNS